MIYTELFRLRIGTYQHCKCLLGKNKRYTNSINSRFFQSGMDRSDPQRWVSAGNVVCNFILYFVTYIYMLCFLMALSIEISLNKNVSLNQKTSSHTASEMYSTVNTSSLRDYINNCFIILILYTLKKNLNQNTTFSTSSIGRFMTRIRSRKHFSSVPAAKYTFWIALLNLILIIICNPAILNPGPIQEKPKLSVFYQNVRGFIPPTELGKSNPMLNMDKVIEFQSYVSEKKPDIVVLNETWLSKNINASELFPDQTYKIFRRDRILKSHPIDPDNPGKFKRNGGGILIAIKSNLDCESLKIKEKAKAEILSVEIRLKSGKSICLCTLYRVGTFGAENHREIDTYLRAIAKRKKFSKIILIGDLNLNEISWPDNSTSNELESNFLDTFNDLNFDQLILHPTHVKGNILDLLLTSCPELISDIRVLNENEICKSDHFAIEFSLDIKLNRKKSVKRKIFNFKKANWDSLNDNLKHINWNYLLYYCDAETVERGKEWF